MTPLPMQFTKWLKACNERFARFSGSQFSPHELPSEEKVSTAVKRLCLDCRKREVKARQRYCSVCAKKRNRESKRQHMRLKRGFDVEKLANSPIRAEALTRPEKQVGYPHPRTSILDPVFPHRKGRRRTGPEARGKYHRNGGPQWTEITSYAKRLMRLSVASPSRS
jgi:hypothetical protein